MGEYNTQRRATSMRTRRPLSVEGSDLPPLASKEAGSAVTVVAAAHLADDIDATAAGKNGYATGNAKYLHILIANDGTDDTLTLYGYNYAFGQWAQLYLPMGQNQATTTASFVVATWTSIIGNIMLTIPINGIDRIGFAHDGTLNDMEVQAAVSTF